MEVGEGKTEFVNTVVIGGGQAGLSVGYCLKEQNVPFVILEAQERVGDSWRKRWDSLHLFTPAMYDSLVGMPFPARSFSFPSKDEMADYLESYAQRFNLPVRSGVKVERLSKSDGKFVVTTGNGSITAENVVVAMSSFQRPRVPSFAGELDPGIRQLHSLEYRRPSQFQDGDVLVVGAGNSGAEIALDASRSHKTWLAGRDVGHIPFRINGHVARLLVPFLFRVVFHRILTLDTPMGRKMRQKFSGKGDTLIRIKPSDLAGAGIERVSRVVGVRNGRPLLEDGRVLDVANVVWCTGFQQSFSWVDLPVFERGEPEQYRGVVAKEPGLYFVGLRFLYSASSTMVHGVARDADYIARAIAHSPSVVESVAVA